jgi:cellobiose phosphorylase
MSPVSHAQDAAQVARYQVEPYVIAADVYGADPHVGRGGWTWYTGSAGWMIRVGLESILGLTEHDGRMFVLAPRIPDAWPGFRIERRLEDGTVYTFRVTHPDGPAEVVVAATIDGVAAEPSSDPSGARLVVPIARDGRRHVVNVQLGKGA